MSEPKHPQMVLAVAVMHVLLVCNRLSTVETVDDSGRGFLFVLGSYLSIFALAISGVIFILLALECTRKKIAKLVFVAGIALIFLADLGALICYLIYRGGSDKENRQQLALVCSVITGISMALCLGLIPLLLFCGPIDLKSHRSLRSTEAMPNSSQPPSYPVNKKKNAKAVASYPKQKKPV